MTIIIGSSRHDIVGKFILQDIKIITKEEMGGFLSLLRGGR